MSDLSVGNHADVVLNAGDVLRVSTGGVATVVVAYGAPAGTTTITANTQDFGPYSVPAKLAVNAVTGTASYANVAAYPVVKMPDGTLQAGGSPVDGDGNSGVVAGKLDRWKTELATDPANAVIVLIGDSTTDETTSSQYMTQFLRNHQTRPGEALAGMTADSSHIVAQGFNGIALSVWLSDPAKLAAVVAARPNLIIPSFGLNDVRLGAVSLSQMSAMLTDLVTRLIAACPTADILMRMPNAMLTTNVGSFNYVQGPGSVINPAGAAQAYSELLRSAYLGLIGKWPNVDVIDIQAEVFGTQARATHPLMADQLHPTPAGGAIGGVQYNGGYVEIARALARRIGIPAKSFVLTTNQYLTVRDNLVVISAGSGYIDISNAPEQIGSAPVAQFPLTTADVLLITGQSSPVTLTSATFNRPFGPNGIRVLVAGDWTSAIGARLAIGSNHPAATTGDRQIVSVDLPSIAAGATVTATAAVTGARTGALADATAVICTPPAAFSAAGLLLVGCYPSANDVATLVVTNPTGAAVDLAASNFAFWVIR